MHEFQLIGDKLITRPNLTLPYTTTYSQEQHNVKQAKLVYLKGRRILAVK